MALATDPLSRTYATMRLTEGASVYPLARNMGIFVAMFKRFYSQTRTLDQAAELTKMRDDSKSIGNKLEALDRLVLICEIISLRIHTDPKMPP
jgi:hypothetical protein